MESVKYYHVSDSGLVEGVALGRTTVVLVSDFSRVSAENEALQLMLNNRDDQLTSLEQRRYAEQQAREAAERRVEELGARISETSAKLELAASMMDDDVRGNRFAEVCRLAISALNPTAEAVGHE